MKKASVFMAGAILMLSQALMPATAGWNPDKKKPTTTEEVQETIANFLDQDSGLQKFLDNAYGYAVFPKVYKGAIGVGGAYGAGQVYEKGKFIGDSTLNQLTIGLQLGGQAYSELIFFGEKDALDRFKEKKWSSVHNCLPWPLQPEHLQMQPIPEGLLSLRLPLVD